MKKTRKLLSAVTFLVTAAMLLTGTALAAGEATVTSYMLNMREGPGTEYTIIDVAYEGNAVQITRDDGSGWVQVSFHGMTGYMNKLFLTFKEEEPAVTQVYTAPQTTVTESVGSTGATNGSVLGEGVNVRSGPSMGSSVIATVYTGTPLQVNGACGAWYEVVYNGRTGYIYGDYVVMNGQTVTYTLATATVEEQAPVYTEPATAETDVTAVQTIVTSAVVEPEPQQPQEIATVEQTVEQAPVQQIEEPAVQQPAYNAASGQTIVNTAMQYIGTPYVWAGTSPEEGFDCSGLVYYVYGENGYSLNRVAQNMYYNGDDVDLNNLQAGDILLFGSSVYNIWHAGIYVGNGQFIHSPHSGSTVRVQDLSDTYGMRLVAARRVV